MNATTPLLLFCLLVVIGLLELQVNQLKKTVNHLLKREPGS